MGVTVYHARISRLLPDTSKLPEKRGCRQRSFRAVGDVWQSLPLLGSALPYDRTLRDRMWMWGHDARSLKNSYGLGSRGGDIMPGEAIKYMGIPNVCMVRFTGTPLPPFDDYVKQFARAKRLTWSFVDGDGRHTTQQKKLQALDLAAKLPNFVGLDMDDFFLGNAVPKTDGAEAPAHLSVEQVEQIHEELVVQGRRLDLSIVLYSNQLHPAIKRHLDIVDVVYFWTWRPAIWRTWRATSPPIERSSRPNGRGWGSTCGTSARGNRSP